MKQEPALPRLDGAIGFHSSIRFIVTAGKHGEILDAVQRRGIVALEPSSEMKTVTERFAIGNGLTQGSNSYFGKMRTNIVSREKLVEVLIPLEDRMVIFSASPSFPLGKTAEPEKLIRSLQDS